MTPEITATEQSEQALQSLNSGDNVLIVGKAGTGKSTLLKTFTDSEYCDDKTILVVAPTGVAAHNVDGFTIHKAFGFFPGLDTEGVAKGRWKPGARTREVLHQAEILVVDEVSMTRADLMDMMDLALRRVKKNEEPFGGVQVILIGDLLQLPPVITGNEAPFYFAQYNTPFFFGSYAFNRLDCQRFVLNKVWRQEDETFVHILNEIREGMLSPTSAAILSRCVDPVVPTDWTILTPRRATVENINNARLSELSAQRDVETYVSEASIAGKADEKGFNGSKTLTLCVGARVMSIINNQDVGYVNGSFGTITDIRVNSHTGRIINIRVHFDDLEGETVIERHTWKTTKPKLGSNGKIEHSEEGSITQFPLILAWAVTIHKAQGKTIPHCYIDLSGGMHAEGQAYVALSRATSLEGLKLSAPLSPYHVFANQELIYRLHNGGF